jgi:hypothetical protein
MLKRDWPSWELEGPEKSANHSAPNGIGGDLAKERRLCHPDRRHAPKNCAEIVQTLAQNSSV